MDYQYLNKLIGLEVEKAMRHHKYSTDEIGWYALLSRILIRSGLCWEVGSESGPKSDKICNTGPKMKKKKKLKIATQEKSKKVH